MKSLINVGSQRTQTVAIGDTIDLGIVLRKLGNNIRLEGGDIHLKGEGFYSIDSSFVFTADGAGIVKISLYKDGSPIPCATAERTVADGLEYILAMPPVIVRNYCCSDATITARIDGVAGTIESTATRVVKEN